jgi:hypothetical protein
LGGPNPGAQFGGATPQAVLKRVRAKFPWDEAAGASPEDLTFRKGDIIEIVDEINPGQGWYTGRCEARAGIFPGNYVDMINPLPIEPAGPSPEALEAERATFERLRLAEEKERLAKQAQASGYTRLPLPVGYAARVRCVSCREGRLYSRAPSL